VIVVVLLDDVGALEGGFELAEAAVEEAQLVEDVLGHEPAVAPVLRTRDIAHRSILAWAISRVVDRP
jgi:hypothetical protein